MYKLELPDNYKIHPTFHARLLKPAITNKPELFPNWEPPWPGLAYDDSEDEYEIEKILDHQNTRSGRRYLVHWLGYPQSDDQWIAEMDLHAPDLLAEYLVSIKPQPLNQKEGGVQGQDQLARRSSCGSRRKLVW